VRTRFEARPNTHSTTIINHPVDVQIEAILQSKGHKEPLAQPTKENLMTTFRSFAPAAAIVLLIAYSVIATASSGALSAAASPLIIAAIGLAIWHDRAGVPAQASNTYD